MRRWGSESESESEFLWLGKVGSRTGRSNSVISVLRLGSRVKAE